jgi:hypothetical protein
MKPYLLFPAGFKILGLILLIPGSILAYSYFFQDYQWHLAGSRSLISFAGPGSDGFTDESATTFLIIGLLFIGFSRLKNERGTTHKLRLKALYWAVIVNCG